jgi:putative phage-type endonuclease
MQQRTQQWHTARKGRITGSNVGAILGLDPFRSRDDVMRAMVRSYHGAESEFTGNVATEWGQANEKNAIGEFEMQTGLDVKEVGFYAFEDWAGASPDGLCSDGFGLEVKGPYGKRNGGDLNPLQEQPHYYAQMQWEMLCTGWPGMHFWQWSPHETKHEIVLPDQEWLDKNLPILRQFYAEYLSELDNPDHLEPLRVTLNSLDAKRILDEIDQLKEAIDNATERKKELEAELVQMAGERNAEIWGRKLTKVERAGNVQYSKIPELKGVDLDKWRGKGSAYWKLS